MRIKLYPLVLSIFLFPILFSSCHLLVEDEFPDFKKVPVLNGFLQADSTFRVQVTFTANLTDSVPAPVVNAVVIIETTTNNPDTLVYTEKGCYASPKVVKAGESYTCIVNIPGFPQMTAQTTVPEPTEIDSVVFTDLAGRGEEGEKISSVDFVTSNDINKNIFWQVQLISEGFKTDYDFENNKWIEYYGIENETIYMLAGQDTVLLNEANPLTLFSNKLIKKNSYNVKFYFSENNTRLYSDQIPYVVLRTVDESYYKYLKQYYIYESAGYTAIGKTPQKYPLYSNVKNGLGVFAGFSTTRKEIPLTPKGE